ncbi:phosphoribosylglycinamide formyltransferase [Muribaculum intestinale]|uniref:phosphoribosylglycinamide formyltransferase n=1 Tax=Muribaculum intestinale TaxID=1796646 RepID=UPI0010935526|nr:phosphoribosylglycinamide formyltransferase [Muribaculum intestinale]TGX87160.1 phosphoribosylglycinamide formyltransferase [Muribaculum intestinale]
MEKGYTTKRFAIFASGDGSNAENIVRYFRDNCCDAEVCLIVCNNRAAGVIGRAARLGIDVRVMSRDDINDSSRLLPLMEEHGIDVVVLAGFLLMVPEFLINRYRGRIINIHPSLLPKFGGRGMYGRYVHEAVIASGESRTGITIHHVSEKYDEGRIIFQASTEVAPDDTADDVAAKVRILETLYFPRVLAETFL